MTSRPARPRTLSDFINRPILKGVAPAGNLAGRVSFLISSGIIKKRKGKGKSLHIKANFSNVHFLCGHFPSFYRLTLIFYLEHVRKLRSEPAYVRLDD